MGARWQLGITATVLAGCGSLVTSVGTSTRSLSDASAVGDAAASQDVADVIAADASPDRSFTLDASDAPLGGDGGTDAAADVPARPGAVVQIALGLFQSCARMGDATVRCWGRNREGQLGAGPGFGSDAVPTTVLGLAGVTEIALGGYHSFARLADATVRGWGHNGYRELGVLSGPELPSPTPAPGFVGATQMDLVYGRTCARMADAAVRCCGAFDPVPAPVPGLVNVEQVALGERYTCVRMGDATVRCWGNNRHGQLGDGTTTDRLTPTPVPGLANVAEIAIGESNDNEFEEYACARMGDGTVRCWGGNSQGQLGDGTTTGRRVPTPVPGLVNVTQIALGERHACARLADATVRCWGRNREGQLGDGTTTDRRLPALVPGLANVAEIAAGWMHTCARMGDATVRCWGDNTFGQLGDRTRTSRSGPTPVVF